MRYLTFLAVLALAGCASLAPTPPMEPVASIDRAAEVAVRDTPVCSGLDEALCDEVLIAAIEQLGRAWSSFIGPGTVAEAPCPDPLPGYFADGTTCWYVTLPLSTGTTPQVVMATREDGVIAQAGGDSISGQATLPWEDAGGAPGDCLAAAQGHGSVVAAFRSTVAAIRQLPAVSENPQLAEYANNEKATVCYVDGQVAKSPPPPASGSAPPSFDRAVLVVLAEADYFVSAGYQADMLIRAP